MNIPLAELLRPKSLDDVIGQSHLTGPNRPLRLSFEHNKPHNIIFKGPPGVGKTSLARLASQYFHAEFIEVSAVMSGIKELRAMIDEARQNQLAGRTSIVFIDEIHRFNKGQQDALLPHTESGLFYLIAATTENPSYELNRALLSRCKIYELYAITDKDLSALAHKILAGLHISDEVLQVLVQMADGDARRLINHIEVLKQHCSSSIELADLDLLGTVQRGFDKAGEIFYQQISALHKSIRGSDANAALYWFYRILDAGASPLYIGRRLLRMAWEDIGLADPKAVQMVESALTSYERLGSPEADLALASAVIYLSVAAKSNAAYLAANRAKAFVTQDGSRQVPKHLWPHAKEYRYSHDEPHAYSVAQSYWPSDVKPQNWYQPVERGLEIKIRDKLNFLKKLANIND